MGLIGFNIPLRADDIVQIRALSGAQPVWLVEGDMGSSVVVKAEATKEGNSSNVLREVSEVMSIVSPGMKNIKPLTSQELASLRQWIKLMRLLDDNSDPQFTSLLETISGHLNNPLRTFMKMETLKLVTLNERDDQTSKKIGKALNAPGGLEDMGKIIAADMFNKNNDRFYFETIERPPCGMKWGERRLNYLINPGNIMLREIGGGQAQLTGMDTYDNSSAGGLSTDVQENTWAYRIFNPNMRNHAVPQIAKLCAKDLKHVVGKTTGVISRYRLEKNASERLGNGMTQGADEIERYFRMKYPNGRGAPIGLASRANLAGWSWFQGGQQMNNMFGNLTRSRTPMGRGVNN
jgi:hypothetical protein